MYIYIVHIFYLYHVFNILYILYIYLYKGGELHKIADMSQDDP